MNYLNQKKSLIIYWEEIMFSYNRLLFLIDHLIWGILIVVFVFFIFQSEYFLTERKISNILAAAAKILEILRSVRKCSD